ncbi:putative phiE125 gp8 family phage protein [Labrenzia sp. MBR-25]
MGLTLVTGPGAEPVSLAELKAWCRVDFTDDDTLLASNGVAAREFVEQATGRQLVSATWKMTARCFGAVQLRLPKPPLQSVTSVEYRDADGTLQTLDPSDYLVDLPSNSIEPVDSWPGVGDYPDAVQVTFVAGYGDAEAVPQTIKHAIQCLSAHWYENREPAVIGVSAAEVPTHVRSLINQAKTWRVE